MIRNFQSDFWWKKEAKGETNTYTERDQETPHNLFHIL